MPDLEGHDLISLLYRCLCSGLHAIDKIPGYFEVVLNKNLWQKRELPNGMVVEFDSFKDFIEAPPPKGFGTPIEKLKELCRLHPGILAKIDHLVGKDFVSPEEEESQQRLKRRLERLVRDFPRDQVLTELRNIGLITGPQ